MQILNKELEKALAIVRKFNGTPENREMIEGEANRKSVGDCIGILYELDYIEYADQVTHGIGIVGFRSIVLTNKGRTYRSELRRAFIDKYMPVILGSGLSIMGTLAGVCLGYVLGMD